MAVVPGTGTGSGALGQTAPFREYTLDHAYDEMFDAAGQARPQYAHLFERLLTVDPTELRQRQSAADLAFLNQGITFTVYGQKEGTERIFPYDLLPRILTSAEWDVIERGLTQRITALNLFLKDIYNEGRILAEGIVPRELIYSCRHYRREMRGVPVRRDVYVSVAGTDLVRLPDGRFAVLEDNLRVPSGVSYMLTNRQVIKHIFPTLFNRYDVRPVDQYGQALLATLRSLAPAHRPDPTIVLLTPGVYNSAYFEHTFLARQMGIELVEGRDLFVHDNVVYMRTTGGPRRVDVIYRRVDDDFLDPLAFRAGLAAGRGGPLQRVSAPATSASPTPSARASPTTRRSTPTCRPSSGSTWPRSRSCSNIETWLLHRDEDRAYVLDHLDEVVVKAVGESGGYGMLIGPHSTAAEREEFRHRIVADPRNYIAQPTLALSRAPCFIEDQVRGTPRRPAPVHPVRRARHDRARRPDARRAAQGLARRELVAGRRQQGHVGTQRMTPPPGAQAFRPARVADLKVCATDG